MAKGAVRRYRPSRVSDGQGGITETTGSAVVVYGNLTIHQGETWLDGIDLQEDVLVGDLLVVEEE